MEFEHSFENDFLVAYMSSALVCSFIYTRSKRSCMLKMETAFPYESLVLICQALRRRVLHKCSFYISHRENLKSDTQLFREYFN